MRFEEYMKPFEGNFFREREKLLGSDIERYSQLQEDISFDTAYGPDDDSRDILKEFYEISVRRGLDKLLIGIDPQTPWMANKINEKIKGDKVVDLGCCSGSFTIFYAINHPNNRFVGIDLSEDAIEAGKEKASSYGVNNIEWICGNLADDDVSKNLENADVIIFQDILYQIRGNDKEREVCALNFTSQYQTSRSRVIIAQQDPNIKNGVQDFNNVDYSLDSHETNTTYDKIARINTTSEIGIFIKR